MSSPRREGLIDEHTTERVLIVEDPEDDNGNHSCLKNDLWEIVPYVKGTGHR